MPNIPILSMVLKRFLTIFFTPKLAKSKIPLTTLSKFSFDNSRAAELLLMTQNMKQIGGKSALLVQLTDEEERIAKSLIGNIRERVRYEIKEGMPFEDRLILTSDHIKNNDEDLSFFYEENASESDAEMPKNIKEVFDKIENISNIVQDTKRIRERNLQLERESADLLNEIVEELVGDNLDKAFIKQMLEP